MRLRLLVLLAAALPGVAADASAAGWSAPSDVGPAADYVLAPLVSFTPGGDGFVTWMVRGQPAAAGGLPGAFNVVYQGDDDGYSSRTATLRPEGTPGAARLLAHQIAAGPVLDGAGRGLLLRSRILSSDPNGNRRQSISWSAVTPRGTVGRAHHAFTATLLRPPALAMDRGGRALMAWAEYRPPAGGRALWGRLRVKAAWGVRGHGFGAPVTLFDTDSIDYEHIGGITAAMNGDGRAVLAFADAHQTRHGERRTVYAWSTSAASRHFGARLTAGSHAGYADVAAAVTPGGRAVVAWGSQDGGEEANHPWVVQAASLAAGGRHFGPVQLLDPGLGAERPQSGLFAASAADGRVTATWSAVRRTTAALRFPVLAATTDATGRFAPATELAASGAVGGLAVRADGTAIVTWARAVGDQQTDQAMAAVRPRGATAFGAPEAIAAPDVAGPPTVAWDPWTGHAVAAWPARPRGVDPSLGIGATAVLRTATRG